MYKSMYNSLNEGLGPIEWHLVVSHLMKAMFKTIHDKILGVFSEVSAGLVRLPARELAATGMQLELLKTVNVSTQ